MSRTPGAKDLKPRKKTVKKVLITSAEANLAEKLGVPLESYAKEKIKARKPRKPRTPKVNWEQLAKQLQQALAKEIKDNQQLESFNMEMTKRVLKLQGIIEYLETKLGNN